MSCGPRLSSDLRNIPLLKRITGVQGFRVWGYWEQFFQVRVQGLGFRVIGNTSPRLGFRVIGNTSPRLGFRV